MFTFAPNTQIKSAQVNSNFAELQDGSGILYEDSAPNIDPKMRAYPNAIQSIDPSIWTLVQCNTENYDIGSDFNISTYLFTVPVTGFYALSAQVMINSLPDGVTLLGSFQKNAGIFLAEAKTIPGAIGNMSLNFSDIVYLTLADTVGLYVYHTNAIALDTIAGQRYVYLAIHLLSI